MLWCWYIACAIHITVSAVCKVPHLLAYLAWCMMLVVAALLFSLQSAGALPAAPSDSQQRSSDQQPQPSKVQQLALTDSAKAGAAAAAKVAASSTGKVAIVKDTGSGSEALTFTSAQVSHLRVSHTP
jgi:hypothetical protein